MLNSVLITVHTLVAFALIGIVLIQHGKGADMGAAFGSGASGTVFGAQGSGNFLTKATAVLAAVFFITSLTLARMSTETVDRKSIMERAAGEQVEQQVPTEAPLAGGLQDGPSVPMQDSAPVSDLPVVPE